MGGRLRAIIAQAVTWGATPSAALGAQGSIHERRGQLPQHHVHAARRGEPVPLNGENQLDILC